MGDDIPKMSVEHLGRVESVDRSYRGSWVSVSLMLPECRSIAYTPNTDESMRYRIIPAGLFAQTATNATYWTSLPPMLTTQAE